MVPDAVGLMLNDAGILPGRRTRRNVRAEDTRRITAEWVLADARAGATSVKRPVQPDVQRFLGGALIRKPRPSRSCWSSFRRIATEADEPPD